MVHGAWVAVSPEPDPEEVSAAPRERLAARFPGEVTHAGAPVGFAAAAVLRPVSRRVAELVGYLGFVPVRRQDAVPGRPAYGGGRSPTAAGIHPGRVIVGAHPGRGGHAAAWPAWVGA
jgi:hypothetical protein